MKNTTAQTPTQCTADKTKSTATDPEHKLIEDLMKNYNLDARPVLNKSEPIKILFDLAFNQIVELVSGNQILHCLGSYVVDSFMS